jgi:hypothetical protein
LTIQYHAYRDRPGRIPDHAALDSVAEILAEVCWLKSEHLETSWQDANIVKIALDSLSKADTQTITSPQTRSIPLLQGLLHFPDLRQDHGVILQWLFRSGEMPIQKTAG